MPVFQITIVTTVLQWLDMYNPTFKSRNVSWSETWFILVQAALQYTRGLYTGKYHPPLGGGDISRCHLAEKIWKGEEKKEENVKEKLRKGEEKEKKWSQINNGEN